MNEDVFVITDQNLQPQTPACFFCFCRVVQDEGISQYCLIFSSLVGRSVLSRPTEYLGAPASNAGDEFHEAWALGKALMLLDPATRLTELTVEGVRDAAETDDTANWDGVDCALYFDHPNDPQKSRTELIQLKYSVASKNKKWTLARFCSSTKTKGNNSVARRLADAFKGESRGKKPDQVEASLSIKLVTNQPIASNLLNSVSKAACGSLEGEDYDTLKRATGLGKSQLVQFCKVLSLEGDERARAELREENTRAISELIQSPVKDMADGLRVRVQELLGPERSRNINRHTVLSWFNVGRNQGLFPCEPRLEPIRATIPRTVTENLANAVANNSLVVLHGKGGCGKTTAARSLERELPAGSRTLFYDCYGAGRYRDQSRPRHLSLQAFTQLSNDLARLTNTPLFFPYHEREDMAPSFRHKLEVASEVFAREHPQSLLVIVVDAADNVVMHAVSQTPPHACFIHQLVSFTDLPQNVRLVVTCRTSRHSELKLPEGTPEVPCPAFTEPETRAMIELFGLEGGDTSIYDFHKLSHGIPRVQTIALSDAKSLDDAVDFLRPNGKSLDDLFEAKVREAFNRSAVTISRSQWCAALDELPAPMPISVLAMVCGLTDQIAEDIVSDLVPNLRPSERGVEFSNEDFEEFCETNGQNALETVRSSIATVLVSERLTSSYAASHLFDALVASGRKAEMGSFLGEKDATAAILDPVVRRRVDLSRLRAALHIASNEQDELAVGETIFVGAEALRSAGKVDDLILSNPDLSAAFFEETIASLVLNDPSERSRQGPVLFHLARDKARQGKPFESRLNLRAANEWMYQTFSDEERKWNWRSQSRDVVARLSTFFALQGWSVVEWDCERWTSTAYGIALRKWVLHKIVVEFGPDIIPEILKELDPHYHFLAINSLNRGGVSPDKAQIEQALTGLAKLDFEKFGKDEGYGSQPSISSELLGEVLFFLEILVATETVTTPETKLVLEKVIAHNTAALTNARLIYPYGIDASFRAAILSSHLNEEELSLEAVFPEPQKPEGDKRSSEEDIDYRRAKERHDDVSKLLPSYQAYANLQFDPSPNAIEELDQKISSLGSTSSRSYQYSYIRNMLRLSATDLLASSSLGQQSKLAFLRAALAAHEGFDIHHARLCKALLHNPLMHSPVAETLDQKSEQIRVLRAKATEKSEYLISIARVFLDFSRDNASVVFSDALKIAEEVDLEAIDVLHALCRIVKRERCDTLEARKLIGAFARLVRHSGDLLESEDGFPLEEALAAITKSNPPVAAMTASRWGDEGFSTRCSEIRVFLFNALEMGWLSSVDAFALSQVLGNLPSSIEDKVLDALVGSPEGIVDRLLTELVEQKILETTPYADAYVPAKLEELCQSGSSASEAWARLEKIRTFKSTVLDPSKTVDESTDATKTEEEQTEEGEEGVWASVDPLNAEAIQSAQSADRATHRFRSDERLLGLRHGVDFSDRVRHLAALAQCARASSFPDYEIKAIFAALDEWSDGATRAWREIELPKLTIDLGGKTMGYSWYHGEQFSELQARSGLPPEDRRSVVLDLVEQNATKLGASSLLKLLAEYANNLEQDTTDRLLARLIERTEARLNMDAKSRDRYGFDPRHLPATPNEVVSALIYRYLGDIDARVRWQASHALLCAARMGSFELLKGVFEHATQVSENTYTFPDCPFQERNADQQLSLVLARLSSSEPGVIEKLEGDILKVWVKSQPHILIGHFLARALGQAHRLGAKIDVSEPELTSMNGAAASRAPRPKDKSSHHFDSHSDPGDRFSFDGMDIIPYWYSPACRVFADLSLSELTRAAEEWIVDRWGGHEKSGHWENEPRKSRLRDDDYSLYMARHGSRPTIQRHSVYLQWHGLHMAVGELMKTRPLVECGDDHYDTFEGWLARDDTTYPTVWISDLLSALPLSKRYWLQPEPKREDWVSDVEEIDPIEELFAEDGSLVLSQHREHGIYEFGKQAARSEVRSKAAFVPTKTSSALLRAYAATHNYYDVFIPDRDEFDTNDERKRDFILIPAVQCPMAYRDVGVDEEDPRCFKGRSIQVCPSKELLEALQIPVDDPWSTSWGFGEVGQADLQYHAWSTTPDDSDSSLRHQSYSFIDGYRLTMQRDALRKAMDTLDCDLIVTVNLERSIGSDYDETGEKRTAQKRVEVIRLGRDGRSETRSGNRGTWAEVNQGVG
ncbi:hypothetical protein [Pelagibius sp. Alg239-R121]|uniref:hypothetical protein n=1 Tax=Pelagibius sp. Alg239-R121 TaxID=2993448 RepID=UPI0024A60FA5|nr:hypothetical protein [Pelagibius sp. Alg239-R121]